MYATRGSPSGTQVSKPVFCHLWRVKLSTPVPFPALQPPVNYRSKVLFAGSCFAAHMGGRMVHLGFDAEVNPTGIVFNPVSMAQHISLALTGNGAAAGRCVRTAHGLVNYDFQSSHYSDAAEGEEGLLRRLGESLAAYAKWLREAHVVYLTLGTAMVWRLLADGAVVANCHKQPGSLFTQRMASEAELEASMRGALELLFDVNPGVQVWLTVSPVRHMRHGAVNNMRSKARLLRLCEQLCEAHPQCRYLPVYEFVMDELRDYRYYRHDDLIHLNEGGLAWVFERFRDAHIDTDSHALMERVGRWRVMQSHRVLHPGTAEAASFAERLRQETVALQAILPRLGHAVGSSL